MASFNAHQNMNKGVKNCGTSVIFPNITPK